MRDSPGYGCNYLQWGGQLPPFQDLWVQAFQLYLAAPHQIANPHGKARVWEQMPREMKLRVYEDAAFMDRLRHLVERSGLDPEAAFPPP